MDDQMREELAALIGRWLEANPMHTTLFGRWLNLHDNRTDVLDFAGWMAQSVCDAVVWNDQNPEGI